MNDPIISVLVQLREEIRECEQDLGKMTFEGMYDVGRAQGVIIGLKQAVMIIEGKIEELDQ